MDRNADESIEPQENSHIDQILKDLGFDTKIITNK